VSAYQRRKGAAGEREWCDFLSRCGIDGAERQLGQARDGGGDVRIGGVLYEVKRRKGIAVRGFLDQAVESVLQYNSGELPVVAMREDGRKDWMILMRAEDFINLTRFL
jgi:hypothetical protein